MKDVKEGKKAEQLPSKLRMIRKEYQEFSVKTFCRHVHQEKRNQREESYWTLKQNKTGMRKHEEEANDVKNDLDTRYFQEELDEMDILLRAFHLEN